MKIKVNRNNIWANIFIEQLASIGVRNACLSPGSRSTPLAYTLSKNKKIKSYTHFDERSTSFFALGLAKANGEPVIVVTTSGTAVAELYPAIIEAYQQRVPLIICTADRPPELIGSGANQTINQHNIFKNHIRWFRDLGLPSISETGFRHLQRLAIKAFHISFIEDRGPVHLNFPFKKPLEPFYYTDEINGSLVKIKPQRYIHSRTETVTSSSKVLNKLVLDLMTTDRGIIIVGPSENNKVVNSSIKKLASKLKYPVYADGLSQLRFATSTNDKNVLSNYNSFLRSENFIEENEPEIILQFGRTPTSSTIENFLSKTSADRYLINFYGDKFDPSGNAKNILSIDPKIFCLNIISQLNAKKFNRKKSNWLDNFVKAEKICEELKTKRIQKIKELNEPAIISELINFLPSGSNVFIGNSLPVRDVDNFCSNISKKINIYFNRGASGIDGVTSTALGLAIKKQPAVLITGDLSFLHDIGALSIAFKYSIPLIIVVINNNGGGIFDSLPIANKVSKFEEYFITPHNLELSDIVKSFKIDYQSIDNRSALKNKLKKCLSRKLPSVLEIQTDAVKSAEQRNKYFEEVKEKINREYEI